MLLIISFNGLWNNSHITGLCKIPYLPWTTRSIFSFLTLPLIYHCKNSKKPFQYICSYRSFKSTFSSFLTNSHDSSDSNLTFRGLPIGLWRSDHAEIRQWIRSNPYGSWSFHESVARFQIVRLGMLMFRIKLPNVYFRPMMVTQNFHIQPLPFSTYSYINQRKLHRRTTNRTFWYFGLDMSRSCTFANAISYHVPLWPDSRSTESLRAASTGQWWWSWEVGNACSLPCIPELSPLYEYMYIPSYHYISQLRTIKVSSNFLDV